MTTTLKQRTWIVLSVVTCCCCWLTYGAELMEVQPLTERILMLHFNEGHVQHHQRGEPRSAEKVLTDPLDVVAAARAENYTVTSADDPAYRQKRVPLSVGRKSKGTDFAWYDAPRGGELWALCLRTGRREDPPARRRAAAPEIGASSHRRPG
jgi:hypothetical protein